MEKYQNKSGNSGIAGYEFGETSITIYFKDGGVYLYSARNPGSGFVTQMKLLAKNGFGLNSYISREIRKNYERKIK